MSVQAGVWNFDEEPVSAELLCELSELSRSFGPDGEGVWRDGPVGMLYRPFHTTRESWLERQPVCSDVGFVLTWDGRLDNREELIAWLADTLRDDLTDAGIAMAAFERWGVEAFKRLVGDWALTIWDSRTKRLILATDFAGTRDLYYSISSRRVIWASRLEALLLASGEQFDLCEEYIACYFAHLPCRHLTPYRSVHRVPPGCFVEIKDGRPTVTEFWKFDLSTSLKCSDADYEEAFREAFFRAVRRRLRACDPVMGELSGGVDTGCIVSTADRLIAAGHAETPRLETISFYVPGEPNWDEMPYIRFMEKARGVDGIHVDSSGNMELRPFSDDAMVASPGWTQAGLEGVATFSHAMESRNCRVVLSGSGGDEFTGGVPNPVPELLDLGAKGCFISAARKLHAWSVALRTPMWKLASQSIRALVPQLEIRSHTQEIPIWLSPRITEMVQAVAAEEVHRYSLWTDAPSKIIVLNTVAHLAGEYSASAGIGTFCWEKRFPMFDRDFIQLMLSIPRGQMQRPGRRRALLRRAMKGIVPEPILERKRKAFLEVRPQRAMAESPFYGTSPTLADLRYLDASAYRDAARQADSGVMSARVGLRPAMALEAWLQSRLPSQILKSAGARPVSISSAEVLGKF